MSNANAAPQSKDGNNPYAPPQARTLEATGTGGRDDPQVLKVKGGQKMILWAIILNFVAMGLAATGTGGTALALVVNLIALIISLWGMIKLSSGLGFSTVSIVLLFILMFVPLVNLITLLVLNSKATKRLREAGYSVGLMGAH